MGPKNSVPKSQDTQKLYSIKHPKFSNVKFLKDPKTEEQYFQTTIPIVSQKQYELWVKRLKEVPSKSQALLLPKNYKFEKEGLCGSNGVAKIDFENYPFLLSDQILNRQSINHKQFEQNQLWYLLFTLISASKDFHLQGKKVGDIRPQNIFINQDGQIKIASQYSVPGQQINYNKTFYERQITYLSPQQMKDIQFGKVQSSQPLQQSESFSIGLSVLDAALLSDSIGLYLKNGKFDFQKLNDKLKELRNIGYSQLLILTISNLCETEGANRCKPQQLYQWLIPFEEYIYNLEQFEVTNLPQKIMATRDKNQPKNIQPNLVRLNQPPINYIKQNNIPVSQSQYVQEIRPVFQQNLPLRTVVNSIKQQNMPQPYQHQINPGNWVPQIIQQIPTRYTTNQPISNQFNQPPSIQGGYTIVNPVQTRPLTMPNSNQIPSQNQIRPPNSIEKVPQNKLNNQADNNPKNQNSSNQKPSSQYNIALEKIDEQLKLSRKMFPS